MNKPGNPRSGHRSTAVDQAFLVSILSGKGGVGKSVVAFNLAEIMASTGTRVLLVDADFAAGNIHVLGNLKAEYGIREFADGRLSLAEAVRPFAPNLDILASAVTGPSEVLGTVHGAMQTARLLRQQAAGYDLVILDHGSGVSDPATVLASASDLNLLLLVPELTSISDCYGLFKYLKKADPQVNCALLLNRVREEGESEYVRVKFGAVAERFLGTAPGFAGDLSESDLIRQSIARQRPVTAIDPEARVVKDLGAVARKIADQYLRPRPAGANPKINIHAAAADTRG